MGKNIKEFHKWIKSSNEHRKTSDIWFKYHWIKRSLEFIEQYDATNSWNKLLKKRARRQIRRIIYTSGAIAASFLIIFTLSYTLFSHKVSNKEIVLSTVKDSFPETGSRKAILILDDGQTIDLGIKEGKITNEKGTIVAISKANESLTYTTNKKEIKKEIKYNTLTVPRGGEYQLTLSDGTKVWLNAESSLRYPVCFYDKREVTLTGEAYFEVAKDSKHPFIVHSANNSIEVLGTKFNVSAYPDNNMQTTLAEGKVKVSNSNLSVILLPNQQATIQESGNINIKDVNAQLFISWAQGVYEFRQTDLQSIAAQLSRWYDVDISFKNEGLKQKLFAGVIFRNNELSFAIEVIEDISNVKFIRDNNKIYVMEK